MQVIVITHHWAKSKTFIETHIVNRFKVYLDPIYSTRLSNVKTFTAAAWVVSVSALPGEETALCSLMTSTDIVHPTTVVVFVSQVSAFGSYL